MRRLQFLLSGRKTNSVFKYVQYGAIAIPDTLATGSYTLPAGYKVDLANAWVVHIGQEQDTSTLLGDNVKGGVQLTAANTVVATRVGTAGICGVSFVVLEVWSGVLAGPVQQTTLDLNGVLTNTRAIRSVDVTRTQLAWGGSASDNTDGDFAETEGYVTLTSSSLVTGFKGVLNGHLVLYFTVVPW